MKKITLIAFLICIGSTFAQTYIAEFIGDKVKLPNYASPSGWSGGDWGYFTLDGKLISEPKYSKATPFCKEGLALVYSSSKWKIIDTANTELVLKILNWEPRNYFNNGTPPFESGMMIIEKGKKYGAINTKGEIVFDLIFDEITGFEEGAAIGRIGKEQYLVSSDGNKVLLDAEIRNLRKFVNGYMVYQNKQRLFGFISDQGAITIPAQFDNVGNFQNGIAWAKTTNGTIGFISTNGEWVIDPQFDWARDFSAKEQVAPVRKQGKFYLMNLSGELIEIHGASAMREFADGLAPVRIGDHFAYVNAKGEFVTRIVYEGAKSMEDGFGQVRKGEFWGVINPSGELIADTRYDKIGKISEGMIPIFKDHIWGFVNATGEIVVPPKYEEFREFKNGFAAVKDTKGKWGFINKKGEEVIAPQFDRVRDLILIE